MGFILFLLILGLLIWWLSTRESQKNTARTWRETSLLQQRNVEWYSFIQGYLNIAKSAGEKKLLAKMLDDIKTQGLVHIAEPVESSQAENQNSSGLASVLEQQSSAQTQAQPHPYTASTPVTESSPPLDNITLLLYFGAFLFVASVGLFVGLADANGLLKTILVLILAAGLYGVGLWLYKNKESLKPAGLTFAGMGIAITPLVGVAAYNFLQYQAQAAWFVTSLLCLVMYAHALVALRKPLLNYIFMFTLLSLFQSSVSILNAPIYFYGWTLAVLGIGLQLVSYNKHLWDDLQESSHVSSQLFLPLSIFVSLTIIPAQGFGQFGVTMLLAAAFYGLQALRAEYEPGRLHNAVVAHVAALAGVTSLTYFFTEDGLTTGLVLVGLTVIQSLTIWLFKEVTSLARNFAMVLMVSGLISIMFIFRNATTLLATLLVLMVSTAVIWLKQRTSDSYILASLYWLALPFVYGLYLLDSITATTLAALVIGTLGLQLLAFSLIKQKNSDLVGSSERGVILVHIIVTVITILFTPVGVAIGFFVVLAVMLYCLSLIDKEDIGWPVISGLVVSFAVVRSFTDPLLFLAVLLALAYNILLSIRFRSDLNRWLSTGLWLLLPVGLGGLTSVQAWSAEQYAWMYVLVMVSLMVSRAIGRGAMFASSKVPLAKYARTASISYVFGYVAAAVTAVSISTIAENSQLHTSGIVAFIIVATWILAWLIEKQGDIIAFIPVLLQLLLLSIIRPFSEETLLHTYIILSTGVAVATYAISRYFVLATKSDRYITEQTTQVALLVAFIAPSIFFLTGDTIWPMPLGLAVAGLLLLHFWRYAHQGLRETSVALIVLSLMWLLGVAGVSELQAYTHILALMFGGFAAWRFYLSDRANSDIYLYLMLSSATIPLALQAIAGMSGGLYGWWLLLEQIFFMLLGMAIHRRFVVLWGLYVAVASVLYQLRHLGYAALGFLALVVIGIAVYQLQKYNKPNIG